MSILSRDRRTHSTPAPATNISGAAVVRRGDLIVGMRAWDASGPILGSLPTTPRPPRRSGFQPITKRHTQWSSNSFLWRATQIGHGMRNTGASIAVNPGPRAGRQVMTGSSLMDPAPRFSRVQNLQRYDASPLTYNTRSAPQARATGVRSSRLPGKYLA